MIDILPSLSLTLAAQGAERKGIPTVFSPSGLTHLGGFLLLAAGPLRWQPQLYEDFLPVSAAGIFQSNLGDSRRDAYDQSANRAEFERALGRPVLDEMALYARTQQASLQACARELDMPLA